MGWPVSSITLKVKLQDSSGSIAYVGTSGLSLRIWGAVAELANSNERYLADYIDRYRYIRSTGAPGNIVDTHYNLDPRPDAVIIGSDPGRRRSGTLLERTDFVVLKNALQGDATDRYHSSTFVSAGAPDVVFAGTQYVGDRWGSDSEEALRFWVNKQLADAAPTNDITELTDGVLFYVIFGFFDSITVGKALGVKTSGSDIERTPFYVDSPAAQGINTLTQDGNLLTHSEQFYNSSSWTTSAASLQTLTTNSSWILTFRSQFVPRTTSNSSVPYDLIYGVDVAPSGNIYVGGRVYAPPSVTFKSSFALCAKIDTSGSIDWARVVGNDFTTGSTSYFWSVAVDSSETNVYAAGLSVNAAQSNNPHIVRMSATDGTVGKVFTLSSLVSEYWRDITITGTTLLACGSQDTTLDRIIMASYDISGNGSLNWQRYYGNIAGFFGWGVATAGNYAYFVGQRTDTSSDGAAIMLDYDTQGLVARHRVNTFRNTSAYIGKTGWEGKTRTITYDTAGQIEHGDRMFYSVHEIRDETTLIFDMIKISKINAEWNNIMWERDIWNVDRSELRYPCVYATADAFYVCIGRVLGQSTGGRVNDYAIGLLKFDLDGQLIWKRALTSNTGALFGERQGLSVQGDYVVVAGYDYTQGYDGEEEGGVCFVARLRTDGSDLGDFGKYSIIDANLEVGGGYSQTNLTDTTAEGTQTLTSAITSGTSGTNFNYDSSWTLVRTNNGGYWPSTAKNHTFDVNQHGYDSIPGGVTNAHHSLVSSWTQGASITIPAVQENTFPAYLTTSWTLGAGATITDDYIIQGVDNDTTVSSGLTAVLIHDVDTGELLYTIAHPLGVNQTQFGLAMVCDGDRLFIAGGSMGYVWYYNIETFTTSYITSANATMEWPDSISSSSLYASGHFGWSLALDGDLLAVGAPRDDYNTVTADSRGGVYIYDISTVDSSTTSIAGPVYSLFSDSSMTTESRFGYTVDISGTRVVTGRQQFELGGAPDILYYDLAELTSSITFTPKHYIDASDTEFGLALAIENNYLVTSAYSADFPGGTINQGIVYIYDIDNWGSDQEISYLDYDWRIFHMWPAGATVADYPYSPADDRFGTLIRLQNGLLYVADEAETTPYFDLAIGSPVGGGGHVRIFDLNNLPTTTSNINRNLADTTLVPYTAYYATPAYTLGWMDVSKSGQRLVLTVGNNSGHLDGQSNWNRNAVLSWKYGANTSNTGRLGQYLIANTSTTEHSITQSVDLIPGATYTASVWAKEPTKGFKLKSILDNPNPYGTSVDDRFGESVAISGNRAIVGAYAEDDAGGTGSGKAYIFDVDTGALIHTLDNPNAYGTSAIDQFGESVAISGNRCIVGAYAEDDAGGGRSGKAYIFDVSSGTLLHTLDNPNAYGTSVDDFFGISVDIDGDRCIVGAYGEDDADGTGSGKAYIFDVATGSLLHTLDNPNPYGTSLGDRFGESVAIDGDRCIVGAAYEDDGVGLGASGKAYIFDVSSGTLLHTLDNPNAYGTSAGDRFGYSVAISGNRCIVGARDEDDADDGGLGASGKAYIFDVDTGSLLHTLDNPNAYGISGDDYFGWSVAIDGNRCIVSAPAENDAGGFDSGKAYIFDVSSGTLLHTLDNPNAYGTSASDNFGDVVDISGDYYIVGTYQEDDAGGTQSGKAYIFKPEVTGLFIQSGSSNTAIFDLDQGLATGNSIVSYANDWYRCATTFEAETSTLVLGLYNLTDSTSIYKGSGTTSDSVLIWGAQVVAKPHVTNYTHTGDNSVINYVVDAPDKFDRITIGSETPTRTWNDALENLTFWFAKDLGNDLTIMIDDADIGDSFTYTYDFVLPGEEVITGFGAATPAQRVSGLDLERISFWLDKSLADSTIMIDDADIGDSFTYTYDFVLPGLFVDIGERAAKWLSKILDVLNPDQVLPNDSIIEPALWFNKALADSTIMIDDADIGDSFTYVSQKDLEDSFFVGTNLGFRVAGDAEENIALWINKALADSTLMIDDADIGDSFTYTYDFILPGETVITGFGITEGNRWSGSDLERISLFLDKPAIISPALLITDPDYVPLWFNKSLQHSIEATAEKPNYWMDKYFADTSVMIDDADIGDSFTYTYDFILPGLEVVMSEKIQSFWIDLGKSDLLQIGQEEAVDVDRMYDALEQIKFDVLFNASYGKDYEDTITMDELFEILKFAGAFELVDVDDTLDILDLLSKSPIKAVNDINNVSESGSLRMTDYADLDYFAEDYVGWSRTF